MRDEDNKVAVDNFSYSSVIGMLLYFAGYSQPDIAYAINSTACYILSKVIA